MKKLIFKPNSLVGWGFLGLALIAVAVTIFLRVAYQYANMVTGFSTAVSIDLSPKDQLFQPVFQAIDLVAKEHDLHFSSEIRRNRTTAGGSILSASWKPNSSWFLSSKNQSIKIMLYAYSSDIAGAKIQEAHLTVSTVQADKGDEWKVVVKELQENLTHQVDFVKASMQLDPKIYGTCASSDRPYRENTICHYPIHFPIDFEAIDRNILNPRIEAVRREKQQ